jgi:uncharacterized protein (TIGR00369 family)
MQPTVKIQPDAFAPLSERVAEGLRTRIAHHQTQRIFGFRIEDVREQFCLMVLPYREEITNGVRSRGTVHGGIVASLADTAAAIALATCFEGQMSFATVDLHVTYVARAQSSLYAYARVIRKGSRINVCDVEIADESGQLVAKAIVNFILTKAVEPK